MLGTIKNRSDRRRSNRFCTVVISTCVAVLLCSSLVQAADFFRSSPAPKRAFGQVPAGPLRSPVPLTYRYVAITEQRALAQGSVDAAKIIWHCRGTQCQTSGPWPQPSIRACENLSALVGPIKSFGRAGHYLGPKDIRQCQQAALRLRKNGGRSASGANLVNTPPRTTSGGYGLVGNKSSQAFFKRLPVDSALKTRLSSGEQIQYLVLTNAFSGHSARMEPSSWRGQILLPDLRKKGRKKALHLKQKFMAGARSHQNSVWFIENPDGSLSKQITNRAGRLAGNITFTKDGSVRLGLDLNGDKVADIYELLVSGGEHSIFFSPAGQAAWNHFMNGGSNPLCSQGSGSGGSGYAGEMISGDDNTALQVICGGQEHKPRNGGSTAGGYGGIGGDPIGQAKDAMCKKVLSQHRSRPGAGGMVMGDGPDWTGVLIDFLPLDPLTSTAVVLYRDRDKTWQETAIDVAVGLTGPLGAFVDGSAASSAGDDAGTRTDFVNEDDRDIYAYERESNNGDHPDLEKVKSACAAGSRSAYCGTWLHEHEHDNERGGSENSGGGNATDPGPDQQNTSDAALLTMCQARAKSRARWAANTKNTAYVHQLCKNPASQPGPASKAGSTTLGGAYGPSITMSTYCGQYGGQSMGAPTPGQLVGNAENGQHCGRTESPGTDGRCHGVGTLFNGGSAGSVNVSYGAVIGFTPFNPGIDPDPR